MPGLPWFIAAGTRDSTHSTPANHLTYVALARTVAAELITIPTTESVLRSWAVSIALERVPSQDQAFYETSSFSFPRPFIYARRVQANARLDSVPLISNIKKSTSLLADFVYIVSSCISRTLSCAVLWTTKDERRSVTRLVGRLRIPGRSDGQSRRWRRASLSVLNILTVMHSAVI